MYRKIFWTRLWSPISISRPLGREIEKLEIGLAQKIFRYTDPRPLRSTIHIGYGNIGWQVFKWRVQNWNRFLPENQHTQGNYWILTIGLMERCQELGTILENKVIKKLMLSKNVKNKKCAPTLIFFNEKKWERFQYFFTLKIDLESQIKTLVDTSPHFTNSQKSIISIGYVDF